MDLFVPWVNDDMFSRLFPRQYYFNNSISKLFAIRFKDDLGVN